MKIALLGAYHLAEGYKGLADALKLKGVEIEFVGVTAIYNDLLADKKRKHPPAQELNTRVYDKVIELGVDAVLLWKGEPIFPGTCARWKSKGIKIIYFSWDDPFYLSQKRQSINTLQSARHFDLAFTCCEDSIAVYNKLGCSNVHLMWPGFDPSVHKPSPLTEDDQKEYGADLSFIATNTYHPRWTPTTPFCRLDIVNILLVNGMTDIKLWGKGPEHFGWLNTSYGDPSLRPYYKNFVNFEENYKVFCSTKINLNSHIVWGEKYLNERTFQILGCGGFQLVDAVTGIHKIFTPGVHLEIYHNLDDLAKKAEYYLKNPDARQRIAKAGLQEVFNKHTWNHRAEKFIEELNKL